MKYNNEDFFKEIAKAYTQKDGERLLNQNKEFSKKSAPKYIFSFISAAAVIVIVASFLLISVVEKPKQFAEVPKAYEVADEAQNQQEDSQAELKQEIIQQTNASLQRDYTHLSSTLPVGYSIVEYEHDNGENIFQMAGINNNKIVLSIKDSDELHLYSDYQDIYINDIKAKLIYKADYSLVIFTKNNRTYTLSSAYSYNDLILISEKII